ncbi:hypothetical protein [Arthrobacter sp. GMC3]|uniref:hypothetical protein n=1 Tax=Arthrobacter sp. GMC3 TaxID=2058894 RepID=UPI0011B07620|nr:hypothetical protein [Arthrobacter sp. GMC3]
MSGEFPVFQLFRLPDERHFLVRFRMPTFSGTDADSEARAQVEAEQIATALLERQGISPTDCTLLGTQEGDAIGDELFVEATEGANLWWASTQYGPAWLVLGTAQSAADFWAEVHQDDDLRGFEPYGPLHQKEVTVVGSLNHLMHD